jgi:hypothetical protein
MGTLSVLWADDLESSGLGGQSKTIATFSSPLASPGMSSASPDAKQHSV